MRAKRVDENINFQRGIDPKKVMDIGVSRFAEYTLMNHYITQGIDTAAKRIMIHEMKLSKNKIYWLGDSRDINSEYIGKVYDYLLGSDSTGEKEILNGDRYVAMITFYDCPDGKGCVIEFNDHAEFFGDFNLFSYFKTNENLKSYKTYAKT